MGQRDGAGLSKKRIGGNRKKFTQEEKKEAVIDLCVRTGAAKDIAKTYGISRETLYNWKNELIPGGVDLTMADRPEEHLIDDRDALLKEIETMKQQIRRLKMEIDIWEKAAEIIKKSRASPRRSSRTRRKPFWSTP